ncbi:amyloid-beta A4 precursor protein-binding family A member 1 isoform X1 [Myxocyprinus asiaticus]|uniref:amyloid-beta A4 precursor protein-binding family A member 1 isoform X1 n=1 Tax=Myxocyprinus asiaticus TaxID=70543 RepID=UPI0022221F47|nr:amyloid-beta A4 precursor protein-binding family A member 1 isoform X1 [Myxocyprinus asiaticus]XP_051537004.1 amyloid-beta A4 precursor protein-binding family A member 1 isoform X1 [Myxocyprinus asiaticus]XP_051537009.1 amyloid-beta A4 precursor protein-binding family A member 1 isoform X1 [Myxocyprinus asiaticus]XP_051537016.1 amyloid-beta A4 precursor protein-binding family A member 1 isoform X1 [Myxocyprinus asiaticus]XP_051537022.1 amyloid-beta A4 precursor protein-binding family A membe
MSHQEAPHSQELRDVAEADLERRGPEGQQPPSSHRRRHENGDGSSRSGRSRNHHSSHGTENNHHQSQQQGAPHYRRYDGSNGGTNRRYAPRRPVEEGEAEQQPVLQPIPRPAVTRYRRQGDNEARLRAQQQRQRQRERQRREAEIAEQQRLEHQQQQLSSPTQPMPSTREPEEAEEDEGEGGSALARSASTESGFHNHTDRAEGDAVMALEAEPEDETTYGIPLRPEAEEYTESAESEQQHGGPAYPQPQYPPQPPPLPREPLPNAERPQSRDAEMLNPNYSNYVYTQPMYRSPTGAGETCEGGPAEDEPYSEPYAEYTLQDHVYEEISDAPLTKAEGQTPQQCRAEFRLLENDLYQQQETVGSRLHHYDERSDGESDSPEKEAEFAPYPRADSCEQDEDIDQIVAEVKESLSSQSLDRVAMGLDKDGEVEEEWPESEHQAHGQTEEIKPPEPESEVESGEQPLRSPSEEPASVKSNREKRDAISLAIKDIKEAIEEVKTRTVRSPYTPDEPKEPIWVMRQDLSPTAESDLQPSLGGDSPGSGSTSPQGAESSTRHLPSHEGSDSFESPSPAIKESRRSLASFPTYVEVPGPCDPEDLIDGIIFAANYLGSTQLLSDKTPSKNVRMMQAQEAVNRIKTAQKLAKNRKKAPEGEAQPMTEVDLFISTQRIKVLNADSQETMMDHPLRTISYIADIGNIVVLMARRRMPRSDSQENMDASDPAQDEKRQYKMICHVFESEDAQLIAQSIGQAFSVAYQEFLRANGINPEDLSQKEYSDLLNTQDMYNDDLIHFSKSENCKDVYIEKQKGEILGVVIVESGWGSILPTVIIANMMHGGPAEKSGRLNIGDQIMSINGTSLVGLPLSTCQSIIKALKNQSRINLNIVRCPPVTTVLIRRPDLRYQLGFSVQNGIICSLMRGGIAERGGVRVGHRIIEINSQSVVATPHEKIVHILSSAVGEIHMKTMPAAMYRLLTAQEQPVYI